MATKFNVAERNGVTFQTTTSDLTTAVTFATRENTAYFAEFKAVAIDTNDFSSSATYWKQAKFENDGGTLTASTIRDVVDDNEDAGGWQFLVDADGTNIRIRVSGTGTVNWRIDSTIIPVDGVNQS